MRRIAHLFPSIQIETESLVLCDHHQPHADRWRVDFEPHFVCCDASWREVLRGLTLRSANLHDGDTEVGENQLASLHVEAIESS